MQSESVKKLVIPRCEGLAYLHLHFVSTIYSIMSWILMSRTVRCCVQIPVKIPQMQAKSLQFMVHLWITQSSWPVLLGHWTLLMWTIRVQSCQLTGTDSKGCVTIHAENHLYACTIIVLNVYNQLQLPWFFRFWWCNGLIVKSDKTGVFWFSSRSCTCEQTCVWPTALAMASVDDLFCQVCSPM